jgi:pimeloyl-ACP methyl ester carboxylesterase
VRVQQVPLADGNYLNACVIGQGPDTAIVLHGGPGDRMELTALDPLADNRWTLIYYDQRGNAGYPFVGEPPSDSAAFMASTHVADLEALRNHFGLRKVTLVGHSWGAGLAMLYAFKHPGQIDRVALLSPMPLRHGPDWETARKAQREPSAATAWRAWRPGFSAACVTRDEGSRNIFVTNPITFASLGDWDWRPQIPGVKAPVLVLYGQGDFVPESAAREWIQHLPNARLLIIPGGGHHPHFQQPESVLPALKRFLDGRWPAGTAVPR